MQLFADYLEPLTVWLEFHSHWALFIAFFIAFIESLAVIGSIIPGTVVMTAIGILAGSGVMRIDLTLIAATLGAIVGDTVSYTLGYTLRTRITRIWPFNRYPKWLEYGQAYFEHHGGKSVLLGRFIGPLRSIIPVIAGMLKMKRLQFVTANVFSAIAWAIVYVTPGILVGAASTELSAEGATRLFILILFLLVFIWFFTVAIRWLLGHANHFFRTRLHHAWSWLRKNHYFSRMTHHLTPPNEGHHAMTAGFILLFLLSFLSVVSVVLWFSFIDELGYLLDLPIYFFFQSLRTQLFDEFFVFVICFINIYSVLLVWGGLSTYLAYVRNWRLLKYWVSLGVTTYVFTYALGGLMNDLRVRDAPLFQSTYSFPSTTLAVATALFGFLALQMKHHDLRKVAHVFCLVFGFLLFLDGFALLYLGDHWATSVFISYGIGSTLCLLHWIFYRRRIPRHPPSLKALYFSLGAFVAVSFGFAVIQFNPILQEHSPYLEQYTLSSHAWWHQREPLLPIYTMNRFGRPNGIFNIQYLGSLATLKKALEREGWIQRPTTFTSRFLLRANHSSSTHPLYSFKTPLYLNRKPILVMTYPPGENHTGLALSLWRSNYRLRHQDEPIWLGSLQPYPTPQKRQLQVYRFRQAIMQGAFSPFHQLLPALNGFEFNIIPFSAQSFQTLPSDPYPLLLIIKETH